MLTSSRAWAGLRHAHIVCMVGVQKQTLATPPGLHPTVETLLRHCLARKPEARPSFQSIADTLSHFVQVTRGVDPAELWGASASTTSPPGACVCAQAGGADCCITCSHTSVCAQASCFRCQFVCAATPTASPIEVRGSMPRDSDALPPQAQKKSPSMPKDGDAAGQVLMQSRSCSAVSKVDVEAAVASAQADQAKSSYSSTPGGKGMKRTLLSI